MYIPPMLLTDPEFAFDYCMQSDNIFDAIYIQETGELPLIEKIEAYNLEGESSGILEECFLDCIAFNEIEVDSTGANLLPGLGDGNEKIGQKVKRSFGFCIGAGMFDEKGHFAGEMF